MVRKLGNMYVVLEKYETRSAAINQAKKWRNKGKYAKVQKRGMYYYVMAKDK